MPIMANRTGDSVDLAFPFRLAEECGLAATAPASPMSDIAYESFSTKYLQYVERRDQWLEDHVGRQSVRVRAFVPMGDRLLALASQVFWYFDELLVADPLRGHCGIADPDLREEAKVKLSHNLGLLLTLRKPVESGYILLAPSVRMRPPEAQSPQVCVDLSTDPDVQGALDQAVSYGMERRSNAEGLEFLVWESRLDHVFTKGWYGTVPPGTTTTPLVRVDERFKACERAALEALLGRSLNGVLRPSYAREIEWTIATAQHANKLAAAVFFDREAHAVILARSPSLADQHARNAQTIAPLSLSVPYLQGVPPDRLIELRESQPLAFLEFRRRLADHVRRATESTSVVANEQLAADIERDIVPQVRELDAEMRAAAAKARIVGIGLPVITSMGALIGAKLGLPSYLAVSGALTGMVPAVMAIAERSARVEQLASKPYYFLWRATR